MSDSVNCYRCGARGDADCVCGMPPSIARQLPPPHLRGSVPSAKVHDPRGDELRARVAELEAEVERWRRETKAPPLPVTGCDCYACVVLRRHQRELRH